MSTSNLTTYYKSSTHDYESFFSNYEENPKEKEVRKQITELTKQLESAKVKLTTLTTTRYNKDFTPTEELLLIHYSTNRGNNLSLYFDLYSGKLVNIDDMDNDKKLSIKEVNVKTGSFWITVGYCFPLGAAVVRHYKYKISSSNDSCSLVSDGESLCPILDVTSTPIFSSSELAENTAHYDYPLRNSAKEFISQMYDIPMENVGINCTLSQLRSYLAVNKSTEIILRTAPKDCVKMLLDRKFEKAEPINKLVELTKKDYDYAVEHGILKNWITLRDDLAYSDKDIVMNCAHYTTQNWFDLIEKGKYWDEEMTFNHIDFSGSCFSACLRKYFHHSSSYGARDAKFHKYYTFGKFMDYVCEEAINQGFTNLLTFINELKDYINMCETMNLKPTLYSSYLVQTHDITARNFNIKLTEEQDEMFNSAYKDFKNYTTADKVYSIIRPKNADDIKKEGSELNHCVASYISRVVRHSTLIVFLRFTDNIDKSLVTLEICERKIVQARGASNRSITKEEYEAIREFARANKLGVKVSPRD